MILDELDVRHAAMAYVADQTDPAGRITRAQLEAFTYAGEDIKLIDQSRGIRNPRQLMATLTILSQPKGPYDDVETEDGLLRYAYRTGSPDSSDNRKLRQAAGTGLPLILLRGIAPGVFALVGAHLRPADHPAHALGTGLRRPAVPDRPGRAHAEAARPLRRTPLALLGWPLRRLLDCR